MQHDGWRNELLYSNRLESQVLRVLRRPQDFTPSLNTCYFEKVNTFRYIRQNRALAWSLAFELCAQWWGRYVHI
jgi:hypothetical protein